ncbi:MAG: winged helix-turn-helix transcriptional regulator [Phycisphaerae bacterium]|nr:winged helix-turn-helix transcriptional regulator [Phycisphaerae bacterium]
MNAKQKRLYDLKADILQGIAQPIRLQIVDTLAGGELCVCDIVTRVAAERSNVSRHLGVMLRAGILEVRREGLKMIYRLGTPCIVDFLGCIERMVCERIKSDAAILKGAKK